MMQKNQMGIVVIGDEDLVSGMRLAGVSRYYTVDEKDKDARETVRKTILSLIGEPDVGVIALQEDFSPFIQDIIKNLRDEKRVIPIIVEVPSKYGANLEDIIARYKSYIRRFVGFEIQI